jgi:hypothetical protein
VTLLFLLVSLSLSCSVSCCAWIQQLSRLFFQSSLCSVRPRVTHVGTVNMYRCPSLCMFVAHYFFVHFFFCPFERSAEPSKNFHHSQETVYLLLTVSLCSGKSTRGFFFTRNEKKKSTAKRRLPMARSGKPVRVWIEPYRVTRWRPYDTPGSVGSFLQ